MMDPETADWILKVIVKETYQAQNNKTESTSDMLKIYYEGIIQGLDIIRVAIQNRLDAQLEELAAKYEHGIPGETTAEQLEAARGGLE